MEKRGFKVRGKHQEEAKGMKCLMARHKMQQGRFLRRGQDLRISWLSQAVGKRTEGGKSKACQKETPYQGTGIQVLCKGNVNEAVLGLRGLWANEVHRNSSVLGMWMCCVWGNRECRTTGRNLGTAGKFLWKVL